MKQNTSGQTVSAQMINASTGADFTGTVNVRVTKDGGTQTAAGGTVTNEGNGEYSYAPTQSETNAAHVLFQFYGTGAITVGIQTWPSFPQTADVASGVAVNSIANDAITAAAIADNAIDANAIASSAITAGKIATGAITAAKFAAGAIDAAAIATDAIDSDAIAASAVTELQSGLATASGLAAATGPLATSADLARALGLALDNAMIDECVYSSGKLTSSRVRVFADASALAAATPGAADDADSEIARYVTAATYSGDNLTSYEMTREL